MYHLVNSNLDIDGEIRTRHYIQLDTGVKQIQQLNPVGHDHKQRSQTMLQLQPNP